MCVCFCIVFFGDKKEKLLNLSLPVLPSLDYWILLVYLASVQNRGKDTHLGFRFFLDLSRGEDFLK